MARRLGRAVVLTAMGDSQALDDSGTFRTQRINSSVSVAQEVVEEAFGSLDIDPRSVSMDNEADGPSMTFGGNNFTARVLVYDDNSDVAGRYTVTGEISPS